MTCIVGLVDGEKVYIGGDSVSVDGHRATIRDQEKVFHVGEFLIGAGGSARFGDLLRFAFNPPKRPDTGGIVKYLVNDFADAIRETVKQHGNGYSDKDREFTGGDFLVGYRGRLFAVYSDYQVARPVDRYIAVGSGGEVATGAMYATEHVGAYDPESRIKLALKAAERHTAYVRSPFYVLSTTWV